MMRNTKKVKPQRLESRTGGAPTKPGTRWKRRGGWCPVLQVVTYRRSVPRHTPPHQAHPPIQPWDIQGYITSAAVDNQAKKPPKLSVMTMKWSKIQSDKPECCALGNIKGWHAIKIYVIQHPCDTNIQTFQVFIWLWQKHLLVSSDIYRVSQN